MGIFSLEQKDNLIWLGRYTERVYTTLKNYFLSYDKMIDIDDDYYKVFCASLDIPDIYTSKEDFLDRYTFDETNPDSLYSNLERAYGNAIVLREEIGSEALAYIQLAVYEMQKARLSDAPLVSLQKVADNLLSFWGAEDDSIENEQIRNLVKLGKRIERLDLYSRLEMPSSLMQTEKRRLEHRIATIGVKYDEQYMQKLGHMIDAEVINYHEVVKYIEKFAV